MLHCVQPGAQNHSTTGRPDASTSVVGSMSRSSKVRVGAAPCDVSTEPTESAESVAHAVAMDDTASNVVTSNERERFTTTR